MPRICSVDTSLPLLPSKKITSPFLNVLESAYRMDQLTLDSRPVSGHGVTFLKYIEQDKAGMTRK